MNDAGFSRRDADIGELLSIYLETRDAKEALVAKQRAHLKKYDAVLAKIESQLMAHLTEHKTTSASSANATAYISHKQSASIADPVTFKGYVIENRAWDMLDWKANVTAVQDFLKEHEQLPPGVNLNTRITVNVMRK